MITIRKSEDRGHFDHGWLDTFHTFSFDQYRDARHMGFRSLRVINEDRLEPGSGFPAHEHQNMEILTYVLEGALEHRDSLDNALVLRAGEFQRMTAGRGILHSEFNPSPSEPVHLLQIWIRPAQRDLEPSYEQRAFAANGHSAQLQLLASPEGRDDSLTIHQDARVYRGLLSAGAELEYPLAAGRHGWLQVVRGELDLGARCLAAGDAAAVSDESLLHVRAPQQPAEFLIFDLA